MKNLEVAELLFKIADLLELQEVRWKPQAYKRAAQVIEGLDEEIEAIHQRGELEQIPGVGVHIAAKIAEFLDKGKLKYYEKLKKEVKIDLEQLQKIPFLGPRKIKVLYKELGVKNIKDLEKVIKRGKLQELSGFGEKTAEILLEGIKLLKENPQRFLYERVLPIAQKIKQDLSEIRVVKKVVVAGSFRRKKSTIGDLDLLVVSTKPAAVMKFFTEMPEVKKVLARGATKSSVRLQNNLQVDLRVVKDKEFGAALLYFTGNKEHNIALRKIALKKGWTLNEYGLFTLGEKKWVAGKTEEQIYKKLGLKYVEPKKRLGKSEV